jgi:hypothetical protein
VKQNFDKCLEMLLKHEGGFVNHPADPGGVTNLGITKRTYERYLGREVTIQEMKDLTEINKQLDKKIAEYEKIIENQKVKQNAQLNGFITFIYSFFVFILKSKNKLYTAKVKIDCGIINLSVIIVIKNPHIINSIIIY